MKCSKLIYVNIGLACCFLFTIVSFANDDIVPIPTKVKTNKDLVEVGKKLFFDTRLSANDELSCASCHNVVDGWGAEPSAVSTGIRQQLGKRNSPTIFNSVLNFKQFWDGRADNLSHQASFPVTDQVEMGMSSWDEVIVKLKGDNYYTAAFKQLGFDGVNKKAVVEAIAEYEKTLLTPNSPFDQFLNGDVGALNQQQIDGYRLFKSYGCISCHQGVNVGGNMFQKFGVLEDISLHNGSLSEDLGRYNVTENEWDKRVFKVPSLRLAAVTPPYFHDGSVKTLQDAVEIMIEFQLGRGVPDEDRDAIISFLGSLVGEKPQGVK
ncbi:cytochrome-c peroxidase [Arenicella sp. 4NH20-0111]|uniref:cytochrome-c peroxidase n=1 Tax=Arenicella sp. 4NH20-0111 TaxID=3127648 RepID=UPI0031065B59